MMFVAVVALSFMVGILLYAVFLLMSEKSDWRDAERFYHGSND